MIQRYYLYGKDDLGNEYEALIRQDDWGDYVLYSDHLTAMEEAKQRIEQLEAERDRLDNRDGTASIQIIHPVLHDPNPFHRIKLQIVDFGVADNCYVVECPEIETEIAALTAENARLREGITQYKEFFQKHQAVITDIILSEDGINKLVIGEAVPDEADFGPINLNNTEPDILRSGMEEKDKEIIIRADLAALTAANTRLREGLERVLISSEAIDCHIEARAALKEGKSR